VLAVVVATSALMADSNAAMLRTAGVVTVNGKGTSNSAAVFAGDIIRAADNSSFVITSSGSMVAVPSSSAITYRGNAVELDSGAVEVTTSNGLIARADNFTVTPASSGSVKYQVSRFDRNIVVAAKQGSVFVSDGSQRKLLTEGNTTESSDSKDKGAIYAGPAPAGKMVCCVLPAVAGLSGSVAAIVVSSRKSISNSQVN
jgi:ferric-dicitrate binding protein FerR (iron transport regulator)